MKTDARMMAAAAMFAGVMLGVVGCEFGSPNRTERQVGVNIDGFYTGQLAEGRLTSSNSGAPVTSLNLRQAGASLEGQDNNGRRFAGSINGESENRVPFTLEGQTTAGARVTLIGTVNISGTTATMTGTWVEPDRTANVLASTTVSTNAPVSGLSISPAGPITIGTSASQNFSVSGGSGTYSWSLGSASLGSLSATTGGSVVYTAGGAGSQSVSVSDGSSTRSATVTQQ